MQQIPEDRDLEEKITSFLRWERRLDFLSSYGVGVWFLPFLIAVIVVGALNLELSMLTTFLWPLLLVIPAVVLLALWRWYSKKKEEYTVSDSEWAQFYTSLMYNNLVMYFANKNSIGMSKKYRKQALKSAEDFLSCLEKRWIIGSFELLSYVEYLVLQIKNDIRHRIIPALDKGNDAVLARLAQILYNSYYFSKPLSVEKLKLLSDMMSNKEDTRLPSSEPRAPKSLVVELSLFLKKPSLERHIVVGFATFFISYFSGYLAWYSGIPKEYVWIGGITIFFGVLAIYVRRQPKTEK